jgi:hypothetical protein
MRPRSLAEVSDRHRAGQDFSVALREFLDEFYLANRDERQTMLEVEPAVIGDARKDAYLGAVAEHLAQRWNLDRIPKWTLGAVRFLDWPWFDEPFNSPKLRMILLMESPVAFRRRQIFTEAEPLRRARMPRDSRAIANERGL